MSNIELKAIKDLVGMNFFIPNYQRGYRWTCQQVKDLLDDIKEFMENNSTNIYCIQPLVVKQAPIREELLDKDLKVVPYSISTSNHNYATSATFYFVVVPYSISTSNHNFRYLRTS